MERSREMYSAAIYKEDFLAVKKLLKPYQEKHDRRAERVIRHLENATEFSLGTSVSAKTMSYMKISVR